jgi:hypothetical protein
MTAPKRATIPAPKKALTSTSHKTKRPSRTASGRRSGLEDTLANELLQHGVPFVYEGEKVKYVKPAKAATYLPDFRLPNGIIIEGKGRFLSADRQKHLLIRDQQPDLDIRFVFSRSAAKISKTSKTTYADWCQKNGFRFADRLIPQAWIEEALT